MPNEPKNLLEIMRNESRNGQAAIAKYAGSTVSQADEWFPTKYKMEEITIQSKHSNPDKRLDETMIQAITLGAMLDFELLDKCTTSSGLVGGPEVYQDYVLSNVLSRYDARSTDFYRAMVIARKNAKAAIEAYDRGDETLVKKYANVFTSYVEKKGVTTTLSNGTEGATYASALDLYIKASKHEVFKDTKLSDVSAEKLKEREFANEMLKRANEDLEQLYSAENITAKDRKDRILGIMTAYTVTNLAHSYREREFRRSVSDLVDDMMVNYNKYLTNDYLQKTFPGLDIEENRTLLENNWLKTVTRTNNDMQMEYSAKEFSYQNYMLSDPERRAKYLKALSEIIERSKTFQDIVNEPDKMKSTNALVDLQHENYLDDAQGNRIDFTLYRFSEDEKQTFQKLSEDMKAANESALMLAFQEKVFENYKKNVEAVLQKESLSERMKEQLAAAKLPAIKTDAFFTSELKPVFGNEAFQTPGTTMYGRLPDRKGYVKITSKAGQNGQVDFDFETLDAFPITSDHPIVQARIYDNNGELAKARIQKPENEALNVTETLPELRKIMKATGGSNQNSQEYKTMEADLAELEKLVNTYYEKETYEFKGEQRSRYKNSITAEQKQTLLNQYSKVGKSAENYLSNHMEDRVVVEMYHRLVDDNETLKALKLGEGSMPLPTALSNRRNKVMQHADEFKKDFEPLSEPKDPMPALVQVGSDLVLRYLENKVGLLRTPDGALKREDKCYFRADGTKLTGEVVAEIIRKEKNQIVRFGAQHGIGTDYFYGGADEVKKNPAAGEEKYYSKDELIQAIKTLNPDYQVPTEEEAARREAFSQSISRIVSETGVNISLERMIAKKGGTASRDFDTFLVAEEPGKTKEQVRAENEALFKLASGTKEQKKEAFELCIDRLRKLDLKEYDLDNDNLLMSHPHKICSFAMQGQDLECFMLAAKKAGVDIFSPKYDDVRNKIPVIENMAWAWRSKIVFMTNPTYKYLDYKQLPDVAVNDMDKIEGAPQQTTFALNQVAGLDMQQIADAKVFLTPGKTFAEKLELAYKNTPNVLFKDRDKDKDVMELKHRLEQSVRTRLGKPQENSDRYKKVITALENLHSANAYRKEEMRAALRVSCQEYLTNRSNHNEHWNLVKEVYDKAETWKPEMEALRKDSLQLTGELLADGFHKYLKELAADPDAPRFQKALTKLETKDNLQKLITGISKTDYCQKLAKDSQKLCLNDQTEFRTVCYMAVKKTAEKFPNLNLGLETEIATAMNVQPVVNQAPKAQPVANQGPKVQPVVNQEPKANKGPKAQPEVKQKPQAKKAPKKDNIIREEEEEIGEIKTTRPGVKSNFLKGIHSKKDNKLTENEKKALNELDPEKKKLLMDKMKAQKAIQDRYQEKTAEVIPEVNEALEDIDASVSNDISAPQA